MVATQNTTFLEGRLVRPGGVEDGLRSNLLCVAILVRNGDVAMYEESG